MKKMLVALAVLLLTAGVAVAGTITITGEIYGTSLITNDWGLTLLATNPQDFFTRGYARDDIQFNQSDPRAFPMWPSASYIVRELADDFEYGAAYAWFTNIDNTDFYQVGLAVITQFFRGSLGTAGRNFNLQNYFDIVSIERPGYLGGGDWRYLVTNIQSVNYPSVATPVPEPASLLLFGTGILFLCRKLRKLNEKI